MLRLEIGTAVGQHRMLSQPNATDAMSRRHHALAASDCFVAMQYSRAEPDDGSMNAQVAFVRVAYHACVAGATAPRATADLVRALAASLFCDTAKDVLIWSADASFVRLVPHIEASHATRKQPAAVAAHQTRTKTTASSKRPQSESARKISEAGTQSGTSAAVVASVSDFLGT